MAGGMIVAFHLGQVNLVPNNGSPRWSWYVMKSEVKKQRGMPRQPSGRRGIRPLRLLQEQSFVQMYLSSGPLQYLATARQQALPGEQPTPWPPSQPHRRPVDGFG